MAIAAANVTQLGAVPVAKHLIGQAARTLGVSPATLRAWERLGKIDAPPRLARTGERQYSDELIARIQAWMNRETPAPAHKKRAAAAGRKEG